ncbi:MAG: MmgE/PrpD family protein [Proteobacteria bacterium]|nr:MmgE/PrpD family protein [Pseudomonadota bacterium]
MSAPPPSRLARGLAATVDWLWRDDPLADAAVAQRARRLLLDCLGCAAAALAKPEVARLAAALGADAGSIALPGIADRLTVGHAAALLATAIPWDEACEGLPRAHGRPGIHAAAPAIALALARPTALGALLRALVAGYEVGGRLGEAFRIKPGMHVDGTWGTFGAVAAAACLRGLDAPTARQALDAAACQLPFSLYLPIADGHTARNLYLGHAAQLALLVTAAAAAGVTAPTEAVATQRRLALGLDDNVALTPPGQFLILEGYLKNFAGVRHAHYGAACALTWRAATGADPRHIRALTLATYPEALTYAANRAPRTAIQAQFSLSFAVARALVAGSLAPDAYTQEALADPELQRLERLVELAVDPALTGRGATLLVTTEDAAWRGSSMGSTGDPERPMSDAAVEQKFLDYAAPALGTRVDTVADLILRAPFDTRFIL